MPQTTAFARPYRWGINLYIGFVGLATLFYCAHIVHSARQWVLSDWLINYQGGFIRRGFPGEIAYLLGRVLHVSPVAFVVGFSLVLCTVFLLAFRKLLLRSSRQLWVLAIMVSPATLAFQVLNPVAGYRKDMIFLAALAALLLLLRRPEISDKAVSLYLTVVLSATVLSHESFLFYLPYVLAALLLSGRPAGRVAQVCIMPLVFVLVAAFFCLGHPGNLQTADRICSSLGYPLLTEGTQVCSGGAMLYLTFTRTMARQDALAHIQNFHYFRIYTLPALLGLLPVLWGSVSLGRSGKRRQVVILWALAAISFAGSVVLFYYAWDWGRWIYLHIVSLSLLLLFVDGGAEGQPDTVPVARATPVPVFGRVAAGVLLFVYAAFWTLPQSVSATERGRLGYIDLVRQMKSSRHGGAGQ